MDSSLPTKNPSVPPVVATEREQEEALQRPTQALGPGFLLLYGLANAVIGIGNITFYTLLLPERLAVISPQQQNNAFIIISAIGALGSLLTNPLVGAFTDRTTSPL